MRPHNREPQRQEPTVGNTEVVGRWRGREEEEGGMVRRHAVGSGRRLEVEVEELARRSG